MGAHRVEELPATVLLDVVYCLVLEDDKDKQGHRERLDGILDSRSGADGKPDRATWGRLPHQQRRMKAASDAAGG
jgi:hypothetical protein